MKYRSIFYAVPGMLVICLLLASCNKRDLHPNPLLTPFVFMPQAVHGPRIINLLMSDTAQAIIYGANYSGISDPSKNIKVQFEIDTPLVDSFNLANHTNYKLLPPKSYTLEKTNAVIPKGKRATQLLNLSVKTIGFLKPSVQYLLPLHVINTQSSPEVRKSLATTYFIIQAQYDTITVFIPQADENPVVSNLSLGANTPQVVTFDAEYEGTAVGKEITVTFKADTTLTDAFNLANGTHYPSMPKGSYELLQTTGTIPKDTTVTQPLQIKVKTEELDLSKGYLLPVGITSVSGDLPASKKLALNKDSIVYFLIYARVKVSPDSTYTDFDRGQLKIAGFDSEQDNTTQAASLVLDGNTNTFWQTRYSPPVAQLPHYITIDMSKVRQMHGISYYAMYLNNSVYGAGGMGCPKDVHIDVSKDNVHWTSVGDFVLLNKKGRQNIFFKYMFEARYFKMTINTNYALPSTGQTIPQTYIAELGAF